MTPQQVDSLLKKIDILTEQNARIEKYLFAGRVTIGVLVSIALTLDWVRDHASVVKSWIYPDE